MVAEQERLVQPVELLRVGTEHFVLSGDAPAADIGRLAVRLESLRSIFTDTLPRTDNQSLLPTFVIVFGNAAARDNPQHPLNRLHGRR